MSGTEGKAIYVQTISVLDGVPDIVLLKLWDVLRSKLPAEGLDPVLEQRLLKDEPMQGWITLVLEGTGPAGLQMTADGSGDVGVWAEGVQGGSEALGGLAGDPGCTCPNKKGPHWLECALMVTPVESMAAMPEQPKDSELCGTLWASHGPVKLCRVFWGSHGCSLEQGHAGHRHECGDSDGKCCQIERELDDVTGEEVWIQRFADPDGNWTEPYPGLPFGDDLPFDLVVSLEAVDTLRAAWVEAGKLPVFVKGQGWVKNGAAGSGSG